VAWEKLCCPKSEVGLRLKRLEEWNCAAMLKHIWSLFAQSGSIWVAWVDSYWLKGRSLWNISIPKVCSWSWKKLLNLRKLLRSSLALKWVRVHLSLSGLTSGTQLVDCWILMAFVLFMLLDAVLMPNFLLLSRMGNGHGCLLGRIPLWKFRIGCLMFILGIGIFRFGVQKIGFIHALIHGIVLGQNFRRSLGVMLSSFLWLFLGTLLFCGFFSVMPLLLRTGCVGGGLREIPFADSTYGGQESIAHLFFHCSFTRRIWRNLMSLCLIQNPCVEWNDIVNWFYKMEGCSLQVLICKLCLAAVVYHLWCLRNDLCHGNTPRTEEALVARINETLQKKSQLAACL
jgi:hypothetical protein